MAYNVTDSKKGDILKLLILFVAALSMFSCNRGEHGGGYEIKSISDKPSTSYVGKPKTGGIKLPSPPPVDLSWFTLPPEPKYDYTFGKRGSNIIMYKEGVELSSTFLNGLSVVAASDNLIFAIGNDTLKYMSVYKINKGGSLSLQLNTTSICQTCLDSTFSVSPNGEFITFSDNNLRSYSLVNNVLTTLSPRSLGCASSTQTITSDSTSWIISPACSDINYFAHGSTTKLNISGGGIQNITAHFRSGSDCMMMTRGAFWEEFCLVGGIEDYGAAPLVSFTGGLIIDDNNFVIDGDNLALMQGTSNLIEFVYVCTNPKLEQSFEGSLVINCNGNVYKYTYDSTNGLVEEDNLNIDLENVFFRNI